MNPPSFPAVYELRVEDCANDDNIPLLVYRDVHQDISFKLFFAGRFYVAIFPFLSGLPGD